MLVAIGSNLASAYGDPATSIDCAINRLSECSFDIHRVSSLYETPAFPKGAGPNFLNGAVSVQFSGSADEALTVLLEIESEFGRDRSKRWGPRTLDLDLIADAQKILPNRKTFLQWMELTPELQSVKAPKELILPHPRLHQRAFVLVPLAEVAPDWCHPILNKTAVELRDNLPPEALAEVVRVSGPGM
ncbi:MAG: 2-amino-4-hydroxy-6-hydroxymethyldihydropteridine diphosphokinase [Cohaesibacter sp.]|nr:2-amino-4-hydroxy-6-hydroxymethyldihydropteridine diphosphokinase [Cohaesibacter sp.]